MFQLFAPPSQDLLRFCYGHLIFRVFFRFGEFSEFYLVENIVQHHREPGSANPRTQPLPPSGPRIVPLGRDFWATSSPLWGP